MLMPQLDPESQKIWLEHQRKLLKIMPFYFIGGGLCLGLFLSLPMIADRMFFSDFIPAHDGKGLWKVTGNQKIEYCDVQMDASGKPAAGQCIHVLSIPR